MIHLEKNNEHNKIDKSEYPHNSILYGNDLAENELKIFIDENVLLEIDEYLSSDTSVELGGVLLGNVFMDENDRLFIVIDSHIKAEHSASSLSRLTFTHETWNYINSILEEKYPSKKILGWYHSHPGHTVFLSNHDIFIHENFFNLPFMAAYVFDPTINDRGFFCWKDKRIERSKGFYLFQSSNKEPENTFLSRPFTAGADPPSQDETLGKSNSGNVKLNLLWGVALLNLLLAIILIYNVVSFKTKFVEYDELELRLAELKNENRVLKERIDKLISDAESGYIPAQDNFTLYTVKDGDDLEKIANEFYGSEERTDIIMKENGLKDENEIKPGQVIKLPKLSE